MQGEATTTIGDANRPGGAPRRVPACGRDTGTPMAWCRNPGAGPGVGRAGDDRNPTGRADSRGRLRPGAEPDVGHGAVPGHPPGGGPAAPRRARPDRAHAARDPGRGRRRRAVRTAGLRDRDCARAVRRHRGSVVRRRRRRAGQCAGAGGRPFHRHGLRPTAALAARGDAGHLRATCLLADPRNGRGRPTGRQTGSVDTRCNGSSGARSRLLPPRATKSWRQPPDDHVVRRPRRSEQRERHPWTAHTANRRAAGQALVWTDTQEDHGASGSGEEAEMGSGHEHGGNRKGGQGLFRLVWLGRSWRRWCRSCASRPRSGPGTAPWPASCRTTSGFRR